MECVMLFKVALCVLYKIFTNTNKLKKQMNGDLNVKMLQVALASSTVPPGSAGTLST